MTDIFNSTFLQNFLPNFCSDFLVGIVFTALITWLIQRSKRLDAKLDVLHEKIDQTTYQVRFFVHNTGKQTFQKEHLYWHVYIQQKGFMHQPSDEKKHFVGNQEINGKIYNHFGGLIESPAFPKYKLHILTLQINPDSNKDYRIYYGFVSDGGFIPKYVEMDRNYEIKTENLPIYTLELD